MRKSQIISFIQACRIDGNHLLLPGRDDFELSSAVYAKFKSLITGVGGSYQTNQNRFSFPFDPTQLITRLSNGEEYQRALQFFPTQEPVARKLVGCVPTGRGLRFLEPSAGRGALAQAIREAQGDIPHEIHTCEFDEFNREVLRIKGFQVMGEDFLKFHTKPSQKYDVVVANPPFSNGQYMTHLLHAYDQLKPGGSFGLILPTTWLSPRNEREQDFYDFVQSHSHTIDRIPAGAFRESGTSIETCMVAGHRPLYDYTYCYQQQPSLNPEDAAIEVAEFFRYISPSNYAEPSLREIRFAASCIGFPGNASFGESIAEGVLALLNRSQREPPILTKQDADLAPVMESIMEPIPVEDEIDWGW